MLTSGMLAIVNPTPADLGRACAELTITGIVRLIKEDYEGMRHSQSRLMDCVKQAMNFKTAEQKRLFLEAGITSLQAKEMSDCFDCPGVQMLSSMRGLDQLNHAYASLCRYLGIEVFKKALTSLDVMPWGQAYHRGQRFLFSGLPFTTKREEFRAFAKAATYAYRDAYNIEESEEAVLQQLEDSYYNDGCPHCDMQLLGSTKLALDLNFKSSVAEFVIGAHLFAPAQIIRTT